MKRKSAIVLLLCLMFASSFVFSSCTNADSTTATVSAESTTGNSDSSSSSAVSEEPIPKMVDRLSEYAVKNTIPEEIKALAKDMPHVDYKSLPDWNGTVLADASVNNGADFSIVFDDNFLKEIKDQGFNFVRVCLDTRGFFTDPGNPSIGGGNLINTYVTKTIDDLIENGIKNDVHVCLDVQNTFGGLMMGGDEEASREKLFTEGSKEEEMFFNFWEFVSLRYADISPNALSFNLFNEPPRFVTDEQYTKFVKKGIDIITKANPDRLIFVDMLDYAKYPVQGLVGEKIVQCFHFYEPHEFTHSHYDLYDMPISMEDYSAKIARHPEYLIYPFPAVNLGITKDDYVVTGDFPAGTRIVMRFGEGSVGSGAKLLADGKEIFSQKFDREFLESKRYTINEDNVFAIYDEENSGLKLIEFSLELNEATKELRLVLTDKSKWLDINEFVVETDTYSTRLLGRWIEEVGNDLPPTRANIDNTGAVTLLNEADQYTYGKKDIEKQFKIYKDFSDSTGTTVMMTEFGDTVYNNVAYSVKYYKDVLSTCEEFGFNWVHYSYDYIYFSYAYSWDVYKRHGATYTDLGNGRFVCNELRDVFKDYV